MEVKSITLQQLSSVSEGDGSWEGFWSESPAVVSEAVKESDQLL